MPYLDRTLTCRECGEGFTFTAGEQAFYAARGLVHEPARCPSCRSARKAASASGEGFVRYGSSASFGGRTPRQMHPVACSRCGQMTEVPFQPRSGRPVYCSDCFALVNASARRPGTTG